MTIPTLSTREKRLAIGVGAIVFLFVNFLLIDGFTHDKAQLEAGIKSRKKQLVTMSGMTADLATSEQLDHWIDAKQPVLKNADTAGVQLLSDVKEIARRHGVLLENPAIRTPENQLDYVAVSVEVETKSPWSPLVAFQHDLQTPEQFIAVENANLKIDPSDATQMRGHFRISRWFAAH